MKKNQQTTRSKPAPSQERAGVDTNPTKNAKAPDDGFELVLRMPAGTFDKLAAEVAATGKRPRTN